MEKLLNLATEESIVFFREWKDLSADLNEYQTLSIKNSEEMLKMIELLEATQRNWNNSEIEILQLKSLNELLTRDNKKINEELTTIRDRFRESKAQIAGLFETCNSYEKEIEVYRKKFELVTKYVREQNLDAIVYELKKMPLSKQTENNENLSESPQTNSVHSLQNDIDYDKTGDTYGDILMEENEEPVLNKLQPIKENESETCNFLRKGGLRVNNPNEEKLLCNQERTNFIPKRSVEFFDNIEKRYKDENVCTPAKRAKEDNVHSEVKKFTNNNYNFNLRRSISDTNIQTPSYQQRFGFAASAQSMKTPMIGFGNTWTKGRLISECVHTYKPEKFNFTAACVVCAKSFASNCYKCYRCVDCKYAIHQNCMPLTPIPCIPIVKTPPKNSRNRNRLAEYCPDLRPKIPGLIIRCVVALENCFLNASGLYRIPGSDEEVKRLVAEFKNHLPPNLHNRDPATLCGTIKRFLRELREPLIPTSSYGEFIRAVENNDNDQIMSAITELPIPNRDTLAFLCLHWQKIAQNSNLNKMTLENLASCLGPTVVGSKYGRPKLETPLMPLNPDYRKGDVEKETRQQNAVLLQLLKLDKNFWTNILNSPEVNNCIGSTLRKAPNSLLRYPLRELNSDKSFLGPVTKTPSKEALIQPVSLKNSRNPAKTFFERPY